MIVEQVAALNKFGTGDKGAEGKAATTPHGRPEAPVHDERDSIDLSPIGKAYYHLCRTIQQCLKEFVEPGFEMEPPGPSAMDAIDEFLNLTDRRDLFETLASLSVEEKEAFLKVLGHLLQQGVVGRETLEVRGEEVDTFVSTRIGSEELRHARRARPRSRDDRR